MKTPHEFLIDKGIKSIKEQLNVLTVEELIKEYALLVIKNNMEYTEEDSKRLCNLIKKLEEKQSEINDTDTSEDFLDFSDSYHRIIHSNVNILKEEDLLWTLNFAKSLMIDFAKYHVRLALKQASENAKIKFIPFSDEMEIDIESILNSYDLNNIK